MREEMVHTLHLKKHENFIEMLEGDIRGGVVDKLTKRKNP
jgi:hypothetical protein